MKTTPVGEHRKLYQKLTKGELYWCALKLWDLWHGEDKEWDDDEFVQFLKDEAANRISQNGLGASQ